MPPFTLGGSQCIGAPVMLSANSIASGAVTTNGRRNSITAFTGAAPTPVPASAWTYTDYTHDPNHPHAASAL